MAGIWVMSGCSHGLGRAWAHSIIVERGGRIIGITRSRDRAEEMHTAYGDAFIPCVSDVSDSKELGRKLSSLIETVGVPDAVVPAAGYAQFGTLEDLSEAEIFVQFRTNVVGALNVIRPALAGMRARGSGRILLVSSMSGVACWPLLGAYQISKHAIEAIADTLRLELQDTGIFVGCIEPGPHKTGWATVYAQRAPISDAYDAAVLSARASCGYAIEPPEASLPFFWKMFDAHPMPRRITTSREFVDFAVSEAAARILDWKASHDC